MIGDEAAKSIFAGLVVIGILIFLFGVAVGILAS